MLECNAGIYIDFPYGNSIKTHSCNRPICIEPCFGVRNPFWKGSFGKSFFSLYTGAAHGIPESFVHLVFVKEGANAWTFMHKLKKILHINEVISIYLPLKEYATCVQENYTLLIVNVAKLLSQNELDKRFRNSVYRPVSIIGLCLKYLFCERHFGLFAIFWRTQMSCPTLPQA